VVCVVAFGLPGMRTMVSCVRKCIVSPHIGQSLVSGTILVAR
jgi:hypothetical protein